MPNKHGYERVDGVVYCHIHGDIHDDSNRPYGEPYDICTPVDHRGVYFRRRKADYDVDEFVDVISEIMRNESVDETEAIRRNNERTHLTGAD